MFSIELATSEPYLDANQCQDLHHLRGYHHLVLQFYR
jgi:hypothetical protein